MAVEQQRPQAGAGGWVTLGAAVTVLSTACWEGQARLSCCVWSGGGVQECVALVLR